MSAETLLRAANSIRDEWSGDMSHLAWHSAQTFHLAVADWLEKEALGFDLIAATIKVAVEIGADAKVTHSTHEEALAVARAYLGETS